MRPRAMRTAWLMSSARSSWLSVGDSPVVPATREATLVHMMDNLGGTLGSFDRIERELPDGQAWSRFDRGIDSAAYFGRAA